MIWAANFYSTTAGSFNRAGEVPLLFLISRSFPTPVWGFIQRLVGLRQAQSVFFLEMSRREPQRHEPLDALDASGLKLPAKRAWSAGPNDGDAPAWPVTSDWELSAARPGQARMPSRLAAVLVPVPAPSGTGPDQTWPVEAIPEGPECKSTRISLPRNLPSEYAPFDEQDGEWPGTGGR